nr:toll/interleukin-1 receptor domain-containing protein [Methylobacterium sp. L1A1]
MSARPPFRLLIFRHQHDVDARPYEEALVNAFQGGKEAGAYIVAGADLGVQLEIFENAPPFPAETLSDDFCHTLVIVLVDAQLLAVGDSLRHWLGSYSRHASGSGGRHRLLPLAMEERLADRFARLEGLEGCQVQAVQLFGERAIRPAMVALRALHEARVLLAAGMPLREGEGPAGFLRLFISHAKLDGLPLAQALKHQIQATGWLRTFYDAEDLPPGCDWREELERGVGASLIIMLRTEVYETRHWCQQEVRWADEYATPAVLVEARVGLNHPAGTLPFDRVPTVRIPDGNLMRVLHLALREGLRFLLFARRVEELRGTGEIPKDASLRTFSFQPSMAALLRACRVLAREAEPRYILYPDPVLGMGSYEAAHALVSAEAAGTILATPNTLAAAVAR